MQKERRKRERNRDRKSELNGLPVFQSQPPRAVRFCSSLSSVARRSQKRCRFALHASGLTADRERTDSAEGGMGTLSLFSAGPSEREDLGKMSQV